MNDESDRHGDLKSEQRERSVARRLGVQELSREGARGKEARNGSAHRNECRLTLIGDCPLSPSESTDEGIVSDEEVGHRCGDPVRLENA